jgi:hypothetical protein
MHLMPICGKFLSCGTISWTNENNSLILCPYAANFVLVERYRGLRDSFVTSFFAVFSLKCCLVVDGLQFGEVVGAVD